MPISKDDIQELKRIATNTYAEEKAFMNRVIKGIGESESENLRLKNEIVTLKMQIKKLTARPEATPAVEEFDRYNGG